MRLAAYSMEKFRNHRLDHERQLDELESQPESLLQTLRKFWRESGMGVYLILLD